MNHDNKPLTLEELLKMTGLPVWIQRIKHPEESEWRIFDSASDAFVYFTDDNAEFTPSYRKTWLAYAYNPHEDLLTRADDAEEKVNDLYKAAKSEDERYEWLSYYKGIHQTKKNLQSSKGQLESMLSMFERKVSEKDRGE